MARVLACSWVSSERISVTRSLATALRACSTAPLGRTVRSKAAAAAADRSRGAPPAIRARSSAWSWLTARTLDCARLTRCSSRTAIASAWPSASSGRASPCSAATHAAAAASMRSFLRPPPRDSCRTRAVAVVGTSTTTSPRATSHEVRCRPSPSAFSTAHRRCGHCRAQVNIRRYSRECGVETDRRHLPLGVGFDGCGGVGGLVRVDADQHHGDSPFSQWVRDPRLTIRLRDALPVPRGHASVESSREQTPGGATHPTASQPEGGRKYSSQPTRCPTRRYGQPTRPRHRCIPYKSEFQ